MRVLICTTGGLGHLLPLRPLASALRSAGHAVAWVTAPDACPVLDGAGFDLFAAGPTFEASRREFRGLHADAARLSGEQLSAYTFPRLFGAVLAPQMLQQLEAVVPHWQPDVVVNEPAALAAPLVCRLHGLPQVTHGYGLPPPSDYLDQAWRCFETHGTACGLTAAFDGSPSRHLQFDIVPASLWPAGGAIGGQAFRFNAYGASTRPRASLPDGLETTWQRSTPQGPRIYVTFGTVFNRSAVLLAAAQAAARVGASVVVTVGADADPADFAGLGAHVHVHRFVDQSALLPHCDAVVSHGGAGTLLGAAAHGVPHLVLPQAADHFRNARAVVSAGAGCVVDPRDQTPQGVRAALSRLLSNARLCRGAGWLAGEMSRMPSPADAVTRLQHWASGRT